MAHNTTITPYLITLKDWLSFIDQAKMYLRVNREDSKLKWALERVIEINKNFKEAHEDKILDLQVEFCAVDDTGLVIWENGNRRYSRENEKLLTEQVRKLLKEKIKITPYYCTNKDIDILKKLTPQLRNQFLGIVINPKDLPDTED